MEGTIYDIQIRDIGKKLIDDYKSTGHVQCGINGPYDDPETEVRNLAHLIIITAIEIETFKKQSYIDILKQMGEKLILMRNEEGIYCLREKKGKDSCNGVIGHAWVLEAYCYLYKLTGDNRYLLISNDLVKKHEFNYEMGLWGRPDQGIGDKAIDYTLNHQLWFAASVIEINCYLKSAEYKRQLEIFMERLNKNMILSADGKVAHEIYRKIDKKYHLKCKIKRYVNLFQDIFEWKSYAYKERGYHVFNVMALARIYDENPDFDFWKSKKFHKALYYINKDKYLTGLLSRSVDKDASFQNKIVNPEEKEINIYGYPYNVPGFELLYINKVFDGRINEETVEKCIALQFENTYDKQRGCFGRKCHDKATINYRIYEYYRYLEQHASV